MSNPWIETARAAARQIATEKGSVTIDQVREVCPPPDDVDSRIMGNVFKSGFVRVGYKNSDRREGHGRAICIFELDKAA